MYFHRQQIVLFLNIRCQIEFGGGKAVLGISHEMPIQPDIHCLFHTFETDDYPFSPQTFRQMKTLAITSYGIILRLTESTFCQTFPQCVSRAAVDFPLPGIHIIDIMNLIITCQFNMSRHTDRIEFYIFSILPVKIHRTAFRIHRIGELPCPVQRLYQGASSLCGFFRILIDWMITVGWQLTDPEHLWGIQPFDICFHFGPPYLSLFYYNNCEFSSTQQVFLSFRKNRSNDTTLPGNQDFCGSLCENMLIYKGICLISTNDRRFRLCYPQLKQSTALSIISSGASPP